MKLPSTLILGKDFGRERAMNRFADEVKLDAEERARFFANTDRFLEDMFDSPAFIWMLKLFVFGYMGLPALVDLVCVFILISIFSRVA